MAMGCYSLLCGQYSPRRVTSFLLVSASLLFSHNGVAGEISPYTPEVLRQAYLDSADALAQNDPDAFERLGMYFTVGLNQSADRFSQSANDFDSLLGRNYLLNPQNLAISALPGDLSQRTLNYDYEQGNFRDYLSYYLYALTSYDAESIRVLNALAAEIASRLPTAQITPYQEPGIAINVKAELNAGRDWNTISRNWDQHAASWKTPEAQTNWGLEKTGAYYAYALGITGKGVNVGVLDSGILLTHNEFQGNNAEGNSRIQAVTASGVYYTTHPAYSTEEDEHGVPIRIGEFQQGEAFTLSGVYDPAINDAHGTEMSGVLAASRDGTGMHGVAFNANLFVANTGGTDDNRFQGSRDLDYNAFKASFDVLAAHHVILVNQSWGQDSRDEVENDFGDISANSADKLAAMKAAFRPFWDAVQAGHKTWLDAMVDAGRKYSFVQVVSASNNSLGANPATNANLPWFYPELESRWLSVSGLDQTHAQVYNQCGSAKWWCIMGASGMPSTSLSGGYTPNANGTSASAPNISGAMALIAERFSYLSPTEIRNVLLTTSTLQLADNPEQLPGPGSEDGLRTYDYLQPVHNAPAGTPQVPNDFGWGIPDLKKAMQGPGQLLGSLTADLPAGLRDIWANDISDDAIRARRAENEAEQQAWRQTKRQNGWENGLPDDASADDEFEYEVGMNRQRAAQDLALDALSGKNYVGSLIKLGDGELILSGNNTWQGSTWVRGGMLSVDGTLQHSAVTVDASGVGTVSEITGVMTTSGGVLAGTGYLQQVTVNGGGTLSPGHSIGVMHTGDITFNPGSLYRVEVNASGQSDSIQSSGQARLNGGTVAVALENRPNLLSQQEVTTLLGQRYTILSATDRITGQFSTVIPQYLFLGTALSYDHDALSLAVGRNARSFASVATTHNTRGVALAAEALPTGHPVQESILQLSAPTEAQRAFRQLSGQIHADIAATLINDSRYLRDTLYDRLRQADDESVASDIKTASGNGSWAKLLGAWDHASADGNASAYHASTWGVLFGFDTPLSETARVGIATGYTRTQLDGTDSASANSDNFPLALYGSQRIGNTTLRTGAAWTWHRIDTSRSVVYGMESGQQNARYNARTAQFFADVGYGLETVWLTLEPFANLSYISYQNQGFHERGNAAVLYASRQNNEATLSTLGMRADKIWGLTKTVALKVGGELGWLHQYGFTEREMRQRFTQNGQGFDTRSVPASRDGATLRARAELNIGPNASVALGYSGLLSNNNQDNSVDARLSWRF